MTVEFNLLAAKLSEKADNLEQAEEQIWCLWAEQMGICWDGEVDYEDSFSIQDEQNEYTKLQTAKSAATGPEAMAVIDQMLINLVTDDTDLEGKVIGPIDASGNILTPPNTTFGSDLAEEQPVEAGVAMPIDSPQQAMVKALPQQARDMMTSKTWQRKYINPGQGQ
jgi:hypothetical protein